MSDFLRTEVNIDAWVDSAKGDSTEHAIRRVMRVILIAVSSSSLLRSRMVVKGGVLLALGYGTERHTKDVDFSTERTVQEEDTEEILSELDNALRSTSISQDEAIICRIQSHRMKPPRQDASFPTLRISVGYALEGEKQHQRMVQGRDSTKTVTIDLSFNEKTCITQTIVADDYEIAAYSLFDQVAEKYRAIAQQTRDQRNRIRRQDVYDVFAVINKGYLFTVDDKRDLLSVMRDKFAAREVPCEPETIENPEIKERSRREYGQLKDEIEGTLPDFDEAFDRVKDFYLSLPWSD